MQDRHLGPNWSTHLTQQGSNSCKEDGLISAFLAGAPSLTWWCRDKHVWNVTYQGHCKGLTTFIQPRCSGYSPNNMLVSVNLGVWVHKKPVFPVEELSQSDQYWQIPTLEHFSTQRGRSQVHWVSSWTLPLWPWSSPHEFSTLHFTNTPSWSSCQKVNSVVWNESLLAGVTSFNSLQAA